MPAFGASWKRAEISLTDLPVCITSLTKSMGGATAATPGNSGLAPEAT